MLKIVENNFLNLLLAESTIRFIHEAPTPTNVIILTVATWLIAFLIHDELLMSKYCLFLIVIYLTIKESEEAIMGNQSTEKKNTRQIQMTIEGHKVTVSFAQEANPTLSALVRNTLLDAYIRKNGLCGEEQPA